MSAPIRYLVDEHVATAVATGLRKRGVDVTTLAEAGLLGAEDADLLAFADEENRVMVTQDRDFLRLAAEAEEDHPGVAYAPQGRSIGELVRLLDLLAQVSDASEMRGRIEYI
jgi:uncharacterized protein with PIN domain